MYALVTPARDEADNLIRLADAVLSQTVRPATWVIVDNGSTDGTVEFVRALAEAEPWVELASAPPTDGPRPGAPIVRAFHRGLELVPGTTDVIVKLDADVSFEPDYFERLLDAFAADPALGISSGTCVELVGDTWIDVHSTGLHVRGATRAYRTDCLRAILPLPDVVGWDTVDEIKATLLGWRVASLPSLRFRHHRRVGERDGSTWARWTAQGRASYHLGYRPSYLLLRSLWRALRRPAAIAMLGGFVNEAVRRRPRYVEADVREYIRSTQSLARLPRRMREATGRR